MQVSPKGLIQQEGVVFTKLIPTVSPHPSSRHCHFAFAPDGMMEFPVLQQILCLGSNRGLCRTTAWLN